MFASFWMFLKSASWGLRAALIGIVIALITGSYFIGHHNGYVEGKARSEAVIAKYVETRTAAKAKIATEQITVNDNVTKRRTEKREKARKIETSNQIIITEVVPQQFTFSRGWIAAHDAAAFGLPIDTSLASDPTPSGVTDVEALRVINTNYSSYYQLVADKQAWEEWYINTKALLDKYNAQVAKK
jgi:ribosome-associated protein YbcJ (S4-like RNA binding protein)